MNLQQWIDRASRGLAPQSKGRVRAEIKEHFRSAMEEPFATEASVVLALGDAKAANRAYKRVLLTSAEARWMHWNTHGDRHPKGSFAFFLAVAFIWLCGGTLASTWVAIVMVFEGFLVALPRRGRPYKGWGLVAYRCARYLWGASLFWAIGDNVQMPMFVAGLFLITLTGLGGMEWVNAQLRRKLPIEQWPKAIYLF